MRFGLTAVRQLKSNAICVARTCKDGDIQLLGMGCGQPNRVNSTQLTLARCRENLKNEYTGDPDGLEEYIRHEMGKAVLFSDAFFPFPDNVELSHADGIRTIVQPGGSIRDKAVIEKADDLDITMIFTGMRHFKH
jgi:phosphoribosylaminoimidazolecarboxamide formyltransferase/IMP cyclohydrolase